jgi:hypothetical protein
MLSPEDQSQDEGVHSHFFHSAFIDDSLNGWLDGWLVGWLVEWLVGWLDGWLGDWFLVILGSEHTSYSDALFEPVYHLLVILLVEILASVIKKR